jgi:hypothetical protein
MTSDTSATTAKTSSRFSRTTPTALSWTSPTAATPIGLATTWPSASRMSSEGLRAASTVSVTVTPPASQAAGRQRGDSSRPVGNSKRVNTSARMMVGYHHHMAYQAAISRPGNEPGRVR